MGTLYLTRIFPNPPGKDSRFGVAANDQLNQEWVEFGVAGGDRPLTGDQLFHRTHTSGTCNISGIRELVKFGVVTLASGQVVRVHTGAGRNYWDGSVYHHFLGRSWFVWNNSCGDEAQLQYDGKVIDWAAYSANPGERILTRASGTNWFN